MSRNTNRYQAERDGIEGCCQQLTAEGVVEPLSTDEGETRDWLLRELSSLVEGHFHLQLDDGLTPEERLAYERLVSYDGGPLGSPHSGYSRPFWLLAGGRRAGTIAIGTMFSGLDLISISSLYVDPAERKRSIARRALEAVYRATLANGAGGIRLDTHWTWQPAVRFYARIGMWIWMWKHNLVFTWQPDLPPYRVEIAGSEARFLIHQEGEWRAVVTARNLGERLGWEPADLAGLPIEMSHSIPGTFALHLALAGWPLIRSEETWERRYHWSDAGQPEGLAYKIEVFEAVFRQRGYEIRTPRIPGLQYRELDDIE
ncbi:MAG TPA: GNAT family N-acetyltransferase [Thermoanaerobaculia bacterium]|jgi:GNAT superfamily N-acetyltransferase|nr:GNAT family N-acetyltransferase [Thermoanaerobaculia bacterium]